MDSIKVTTASNHTKQSRRKFPCYGTGLAGKVRHKSTTMTQTHQRLGTKIHEIEKLTNRIIEDV